MTARRREVVVAVLSLSVLAVAALAVSGVLSAGSGPPDTPPPARANVARPHAPPRLTAIRALLHERGRAVLAHDRAAFMATVDPQGGRFRARQAAMFGNLRAVPFAAWAYSMGSAGVAVPRAARRRAGAPVWAPAQFSLRYRISHFDPRPTLLAQYPTFVRRGGRWYLGSLTDFRRRGEISATDLWDYAPVQVVRRGPVLALGAPAELATMRAAATVMARAVPQVTAVWGRHWARRVVLLVPSTQREMARIDAYRGSLDRIAALTSAEVRGERGSPAPVGDRVTINPANWRRLGPLGATVVLTHELTHVATRAETGSQTPKWLSEGFAEYVGFLGSGAPLHLAGAELAARVRAGATPTRLPTDHDFRGANPLLSVAYETAWLACRDLAQRYGQRRLVGFYRAVGTSRLPTRAAVAHGLRDWFGLTLAGFDRQWRGAVQAELG